MRAGSKRAFALASTSISHSPSAPILSIALSSSSSALRIPLISFSPSFRFGWSSSFSSLAFSSPSSSSPSSSLSSSLSSSVVTPSEFAGLTSGAPDAFLQREVRIVRPSKSATQSEPQLNEWQIEFDTKEKWLNPLMGWTSTRDTSGQIVNKYEFDSLETAIEFAEKQGWKYQILAAHDKKLKKKAYADNFKYRPLPKQSNS